MYTAQQVRDERISFKPPMSREQFDKLKAHFEKLYPGDYSQVQYSENNYYRFYQKRTPSGKLQEEHANDLSFSYTKGAECIRATKEISFEEFDFEEGKIIGYKCPMDLFEGKVKAGELYKLTSIETEYYPQNYTNSCRLPRELVETWEPVYDEQFKVGDWVTYLPDTGGEGTHQITEWGSAIYCQLSNGKAPFKVTLRKATLEEIAAAQTKTVRMGGENGFDLVVKGKKVFHKSDDITLYVHDIQETFGELLKHHVSTKGIKYDFIPKDLIISKTGCENKETKLTEWLALYELIKP